MTSIATLTVSTALAFAGAAAVLIGVEIERRRARRAVAIALSAPHSVDRAWVSAPDEDGQRRLFVKSVGMARARTVAMDFEVDDVVRRLALAGIRIGFEREDATA